MCCEQVAFASVHPLELQADQQSIKLATSSSTHFSQAQRQIPTQSCQEALLYTCCQAEEFVQYVTLPPVSAIVQLVYATSQLTTPCCKIIVYLIDVLRVSTKTKNAMHECQLATPRLFVDSQDFTKRTFVVQ